MNIPEEVKAQASDAQSMLAKVEQFVVDSQASFSIAANELQLIKSQKNALEEKRKELKKPILDAGRGIDSFFKPPLNCLDASEREIKRKMVSFTQEQQRIRMEAQRKADEEERKRREAAEAEALAAMENGDENKADEILDQAEIAPATVIHVPQPKAEGVSMRDNWKAELTDLRALAQAVADGKAPVTLLQLDSKVAGQMARSLKDTMGFPGLRFYNEPTIAARAI